MQRMAFPLALLVALASASPQASGNDAEARLNAVCMPKPSNDSNAQLAPCRSIEDIGWRCEPNGTAPLALDAHAQCMCKGSYFADYLGCQSCQRVHGFLSPADTAHFSSVIGSVSKVFCSGTPSAAFPEVWNSIAAAMPSPTTGGDTVTSDRAGGRTEISLYATISYSQGPGKIEGSATAATTRSPPSSSSSTRQTGSNTRVNDGSGSGSGANTGAGTATTATTNSPNAAVPTGGFGGVAFGIVAGAIAAAL